MAHRPTAAKILLRDELSKQVPLSPSLLQQQLSLEQQQDLIKAEYGIDPTLPQQHDDEQQQQLEPGLCRPCSSELPYVGVDKVPGRTRYVGHSCQPGTARFSSLQPQTPSAACR